ncbi:NF038129 family PEP-CTERM protein [Paucibacter sp. APW11]|uniref:NF038129 family PEP-CTERM protein n=1 Tax=Roseateles aquae TaxID=3077235 RepID=A0ABU3PB15_9BURK|nr:NF038129 family PEP-CTERM protein [Paucibacter sp. APW11]MDT8999722.1 NF038129 family PEP-CTERM protein [Paucibacter sp. APW11]
MSTSLLSISPRQLARLGLRSLIRCAAALAASVLLLTPALASPVLVTIDTRPLQGLAGYLAFDFIAGNPGGGNTASISSFAGNASLGTASSSGAVSGNLQAGPLTLGGGQFFSEFLQRISSFGSQISYVLDLAPNAAGTGRPDQFSFFLLDAAQVPIDTADPTGAGALFSIDLTGPGSAAQIYAAASASVRIDPLGTPGLPEPASLGLVALGLVAALSRQGLASRR